LTFEDAKLSDGQSSGARPTNGESLAENVMATASFGIRGPHRGALRFTARLPVMAPEQEPQTVTSAATRIVFYEGDESPRVRVAYLRARVDELQMPRQFGDLKRLVMEIVAITPADFTAWERLADASLGIAPLEETRNYYARAAEIVARNLTNKPGKLEPLFSRKQRKFAAFERAYAVTATQQGNAAIELRRVSPNMEEFLVTRKATGQPLGVYR
jgi:hypothetical protein